jgi:hypothetical protein
MQIETPDNPLSWNLHLKLQNRSLTCSVMHLQLKNFDEKIQLPVAEMLNWLIQIHWMLCMQNLAHLNASACWCKLSSGSWQPGR